MSEVNNYNRINDNNVNDNRRGGAQSKIESSLPSIHNYKMEVRPKSKTDTIKNPWMNIDLQKSSNKNQKEGSESIISVEEEEEEENLDDNGRD